MLDEIKYEIFLEINKTYGATPNRTSTTKCISENP
jgi:hypothetical protein